MNRKKRLLIVDDEEGFTRLLKLNLEGTGDYDVCVENEGSKALAAARAFEPDLILLDVIMPDTDGGEVAARIREEATLKTVPIVYLTAIVSQNELAAPSGLIGGRVFVAKPVDKRTLIEVIEGQLAGREGTL